MPVFLTRDYSKDVNEDGEIGHNPSRCPLQLTSATKVIDLYRGFRKNSRRCNRSKTVLREAYFPWRFRGETTQS